MESHLVSLWASRERVLEFDIPKWNVGENSSLNEDIKRQSPENHFIKGLDHNRNPSKITFVVILIKIIQSCHSFVHAATAKLPDICRIVIWYNNYLLCQSNTYFIRRGLWAYTHLVKWDPGKVSQRTRPVSYMMTSSNGNKGQWCGALTFTLICAWINCWVNNREAGEFETPSPHYDVTVITYHDDVSVTAFLLKPRSVLYLQMNTIQCEDHDIPRNCNDYQWLGSWRGGVIIRHDNDVVKYVSP